MDGKNVANLEKKFPNFEKFTLCKIKIKLVG